MMVLDIVECLTQANVVFEQLAEINLGCVRKGGDCPMFTREDEKSRQFHTVFDREHGYPLPCSGIEKRIVDLINLCPKLKTILVDGLLEWPHFMMLTRYAADRGITIDSYDRDPVFV
eukprot:Filipodium_phascolosomae@DN6976_c0_g1_i1.p1